MIFSICSSFLGFLLSPFIHLLKFVCKMSEETHKYKIKKATHINSYAAAFGLLCWRHNQPSGLVTGIVIATLTLKWNLTGLYWNIKIRNFLYDLSQYFQLTKLRKKLQNDLPCINPIEIGSIWIGFVEMVLYKVY